jgi:hypothetical protein
MNPVCFVIMGFGKKIDLATGRELDLDKTYQNIIKPAVTDAGYECERTDEILHSGVIACRCTTGCSGRNSSSPTCRRRT